jgi:hypothetical protein
MKKILNFLSFINEAVSYPGVNLPDSVLAHIIEKVRKRAMGQLTGDAKFGGMYLDASPKNSNLQNVYIIWNQNKIRVPSFTFNPLTSEIKLDPSENRDIENLINSISPGYYSSAYGRYQLPSANYEDPFYSLIDALITTSRKDSTFFNPFTDIDIYGNDIFKKLEKMNVKIVSSDVQKKRGVLVLDPPTTSNIGIFPNGYIRSLGGRPAPLTTKPEFVSPNYTEEDFNAKLTYVYFYILRSSLQNVGGMSRKEANKIIKSYTDNPSEYDRITKELVNKDPKLVLYLPPPEEGFDSDLSKGAGLLNKFGLFD